jgi:hypothetical protein
LDTALIPLFPPLTDLRQPSRCCQGHGGACPAVGLPRGVRLHVPHLIRSYPRAWSGLLHRPHL